MSAANSAGNGKRSLRRQNRDGEKSGHSVLGDIDTVACGVEAWFEENTGYSRRVIETTVEIARALGVPEDDIKRWASYRRTRDTKQGRAIKALLEELQRSLDQPYDSRNTSGGRYQVNLF